MAVRFFHPGRNKFSCNFECVVVCSIFLLSGIVPISLSAQDKSPAVFQKPSGTLFATSLKKPVRAEKARVGDAVEFVSEQATLVPGPLVIPAHAVFHGRVVESKAADRATKTDSRLSVMVDSVTWKNTSVPMCATIAGFGQEKIEFFPERHQRPGVVITQRTPETGQFGVLETQASRNLAIQDSTIFDRVEEEFHTPVPQLTMEPDAYTRDISVQFSSSGFSVLTRKGKNVDLKSGTLVALRPVAGGCETSAR